MLPLLNKRSFDIEVIDVKPPTGPEIRSCARYNPVGKGHMTAVFDPDGEDNKISRTALETLMQAKTFREYPYESVCLEWQCVPGRQPYRTTHRIVDTAEAETITFYHNRRAGCSGELSELELMLSTPAATSISTLPTRRELADNRVPTWPTGKEKSIPKSQSGMNQNRLVAIPLGDCDWLDGERWELVPQATIGPEHVVRHLRAPGNMLGQEGLRADLSPGLSPRSLHISTNLQETEHSYEIRNVPTPPLDEYRERSQEIAKMLPDARSSGEACKPRPDNSTEREISNCESGYATSKSGEESALAVLHNDNGLPSQVVNDVVERWLKSINQTSGSQSYLSSNAGHSDMLSNQSTQPTQPTVITDPLLVNDDEHNPGSPSGTSLGPIYGVSEECEISIENLPFTDDYWTWDKEVQNYRHDATDIYGHEVKIWFPSEID